MACTTYPLDHLTLIMNKKTFERRSQQLLQEIQNHPHMEEIVKIMSQQISESTNTYTMYGDD